MLSKLTITIITFLVFATHAPISVSSDVTEALEKAQNYYGSEEYEKALSILLEQTLADEPQANYLIGEIYHLKDSTKALRYYAKAASLGHAAAMNELGSIYSSGLLSQQEDNKKARYWWEMALKNGNYDRLIELYRLYHYDLELYNRAFALLKEFETKEINDDRVNKFISLYLGHQYKRGRGTKQNISEAEIYFKRAAEYGDHDAYSEICEMYANGKYNNIDLDRALSCYHQYNKLSKYDNYDIEIAHLNNEIEYRKAKNKLQIPSDERLRNYLVGAWRLDMQYDTCHIKKLLIFDTDGTYSLHADMDTAYTQHKSHQYGTWTVKDSTIITKIEKPSLYKDRESKRPIAGFSRSHLLINLVAERHVYERASVLSVQEKELALMSEIMGDADLSQSIIGKWKGKLKMGFSEIDTLTEYKDDGTFQVTGTFSDPTEDISIEVSGTWVVDKGFIVRQLLQATPEEILEEGEEERIRVLNVTADQFTYYDIDSGFTVSDSSATSL